MIPRSRWKEHPRWPAQTLLLESHHAFRGWSGWILERVEALDPSDESRVRHRRRKVPRLAEDFYWWMRGMKAHERYEETRLYPFLAQRWQASFDDLTGHHRDLHRARNRVEASFRLLVPGEPDEAVNHEGLIDGLREFREVLFSHLEIEEDRVIPLLLELEPSEFRALVTRRLAGPAT